MPADTNTASLGLLTQGTGNNDNTWGSLLNAQVIQYIEDALIGRTSKSTTGGATTLTQAECRPRFLDISGVLVSDATFTVPNAKNDWIITNNTTGSFAVLFKTASGTATTIPQGTSKEVYCDGSDGVLRVDRELIGEVFYHSGTSAPAGALECDGSAISRTGIGLDFFAKASTTWGVGNGSTTVNIPDAKTAGKFLRSRSGSVALGTSQSDSLAAHTHTASGSVTITGSTGNDAADHAHAVSGNTGGQSADHTHTFNTAANKGKTGGVSAPTDWWGGGNTGDSTGGSSADHSHSFSVTSGGVTANHTHTAGTLAGSFSITSGLTGSTETRPTNLSMLMCVRL